MIKYKDFIRILSNSYEEDTHDEIGRKYISWTELDSADKQKFTKILSLKQCAFAENENFALSNYWVNDFPINFKAYPNSGSDIFKDERSGNFYMIYRDFGGHAPEERCRLIQKKLISEVDLDV